MIYSFCQITAVICAGFGRYLLDWPDSQSMMKNWKRSIFICMIAFTVFSFFFLLIWCAIHKEPVGIGRLRDG